MLADADDWGVWRRRDGWVMWRDGERVCVKCDDGTQVIVGERAGVCGVVLPSEFQGRPYPDRVDPKPDLRDPNLP